MGARMSHVTAHERAALYELDGLIKRDRWRNMTILVNASRKKTIVLIGEYHKEVEASSGLKNNYIAEFLRKLMKECNVGFDFFVEEFMMRQSYSDDSEKVGDRRQQYKRDHAENIRFQGKVNPINHVRELARYNVNPCPRIRFRIGDVRDLYAHVATGTDIYGKTLLPKNRSIIVPVNTAQTVMERYMPEEYSSDSANGDFSAESADEMLETFNKEKVRVDAMAHRIYRVLGKGKSWMGAEHKDWREKLTLMTDSLVDQYKDNMQRIVKKRAEKKENLTKRDVADAYDVVNQFTDVYSMSKMLAPDAHSLVIWYGGSFHTDNMVTDLTWTFGFEVVSFSEVTRVWPVMLGVKTPGPPRWPYRDPTTGSLIAKRPTVRELTGTTLRRKTPRQTTAYTVSSKTAGRRAGTAARQRTSRALALSSARGFK